MAEPNLRGITTGTPTTAEVTVQTAAGTTANDTVFVAQAINYVDISTLVAPTAPGIGSWSLVRRVKVGNALVGVHRGVVTTDGIRTITVARSGSSSNFGLCATYDGEHVVDGAPTDGGSASGSSSGAVASLPAVSLTDPAAELFAAWSLITFINAHSAPMIDTPGSMNARRAQVAHYSDNAMELTIGRELPGGTGTTGTRAATARTSSGAANTAHVGFAGVMFGISRVAIGGATHPVTATLAAGSELSAAAGIGRPAVAELASASELITSAVRAVTPTAALTASSSLSAAQPRQDHAAVAELTTDSSLDADPWQVHQVAATLTAGGSLAGASLTAGGNERYTLAKRVVAPPAQPQPTRVIAQDIRTGKWLHWDLEVHDLAITWTLSGPTTISGSFPVEIRDLRDLGLEAWGTWLYVEEDGIIRAAGILQPAAVDENETLTVDAVGISGYPKGIPYMRAFTLAGTDPGSGEAGIGLGLDPADIVRNIWAEVQYYPGGDLGVTVNGSTPIRLGTPKQEVSFDAENPDTGETEQVDFTAGPYSALDWFENADCGSEIEKLAKDTPFDFVERCSWNADKTAVTKWIDVEHPRIGRRLTEVRFAQEENLAAAIGPEEPDDRFASEVIVLGRGEGSSRVRGRAANPVPARVRRVHVVDDKTVSTNTEANQRAYTELADRQALQDITELTALARHDNASLGEYAVGDDILVDADVPWHGRIQLWQRVLGITYAPDTEMVKLDLRSASTFPQ